MIIRECYYAESYEVYQRMLIIRDICSVSENIDNQKEMKCIREYLLSAIYVVYQRIFKIRDICSVSENIYYQRYM